MKSIKIAGVPEHFNYPWRLAPFASAHIDLQWIDVPEGTGKICQMLREGTTDMAVVLTEGFIKDIISGNPSKIVQVFVRTPLIWGIHVAGSSPFHKTSDLENKKAAISRIGSGSHLMAYLLAEKMGWKSEKLQFEIVNTLQGAVEALTKGSADYFLWEKWMTKPLVDQGIFRRINEIPTPWPSFVIVVRDEILETEPQTIATILQVINQITKEFKDIPGIQEKLASFFHLDLEDVKVWLSCTDWSDKNLSEKEINAIQNQLLQLKLIPHKLSYEQLIFSDFTR
jgi:ABC-type nitrate/sulfonate/bicarbonate transport system substrate-binding protein